MQLKQPIGTALATATCGLLGALPSAPAAAQEIRDWEIETSVLYYGESDERVTDTSLNMAVRRALDEDRSFSVKLAVDSLTGATPSGAVPVGSVQTFTGPSGGDSYVVQAGETPLDTTFLDTRIALAADMQLPLGEATRWTFGVSGSDEYDYLHLGINARLEHDFNRKNTTFFIGAAYAQDEIEPVGGIPVGLSPMFGEEPEDDEDEGDGGDGDEDGDGGDIVDGRSARAAKDDDVVEGRTVNDTKDVVDVLVGFTQVLSRRSLLEVAFSYGKSDGYLTDPYKILTVVDPVTGVPVAGPEDEVPFLYLFESRPDSRAKKSLFAEWRHAFDLNSMAVSYRIMDDDWGIQSHTLDMRYRWNFNDANYLEPHFRYYTQGAADFYRTVLFAGEPLPEFASADHRLADMDAWTAGFKYGRHTDRGEFSMRLEYYRQEGDPAPDAAVGDLANFELIPPLTAIIAQVGYRFRF